MKKIMKVVRKGFTLIEILVVLLILSVLVAILAPGVIAQLGKEDPVRVAEDLTAVKTGVNLFRLNMRPDFPGDLEDLAVSPSSVDAAFGASAGSLSTVATDWKGPYVDASIPEHAISTSQTIPTGFGGTIKSLFRKCLAADGACASESQTTAGKGFLSVVITGLDASKFEEINDLLDGEAETATTTTGKFRQGASASEAVYLAAPVP